MIRNLCHGARRDNELVINRPFHFALRALAWGLLFILLASTLVSLVLASLSFSIAILPDGPVQIAAMVSGFFFLLSFALLPVIALGIVATRPRTIQRPVIR